MNKKERLNLYKQALKDYRFQYWFPFFVIAENYNKLHLGFCYYFSQLGVDFNILIELQNQMPEKFYSYWFKKGELAPRIKCLKKAIKLCKHEINK